MLKKIVIAEDDDAIAHMVSMALGDAGYLCIRARDGAEALQITKMHQPDLLVLDVMMPNMSGTQVLKELQDNRHTADIPVLVMTAINGMAGGRILNGPNEIVEKPFDVHDLLNKIALAMFRSKDARDHDF